MLANEISDECEPMEVDLLDRSELIARIRNLERQRSAWELRIRACQEREELFLSFVNDMGKLITMSLHQRQQALHAEMAMATNLMETIDTVMQKVRDL